MGPGELRRAIIERVDVVSISEKSSNELVTWDWNGVPPTVVHRFNNEAVIHRVGAMDPTHPRHQVIELDPFRPQSSGDERGRTGRVNQNHRVKFLEALLASSGDPPAPLDPFHDTGVRTQA